MGGLSSIGARYLLHYHLLPEKRLVELLADLLGVKLVAATIARISRDCTRRFQGFADVMRDHIAAAPIKHMDETGFRIGGRTQWLHIASTVLTFYRVCAKRLLMTLLHDPGRAARLVDSRRADKSPLPTRAS